MADTLKQDFIEAIRLTPEGISAFLETPIPEAPTISTPADVDAAIIANGVAAKYILDLFNAYAGYTPIEGMLRIGQHNSVLESAMVAGLEYITETEEVNDLEILAPESGSTLKPGDVLLKAQAKNGTLIQCAVEIEGHAPISLDDTDGIFEGTITLEEPGEYTANFSGLFEKDKTATASTSITIDEDGDEPGGTDKKALQKALQLLTDSLFWILKNITRAPAATITTVKTAAQAAFATISGIISKLIKPSQQSAWNTIQTTAQEAFGALSQAIEDGSQAAAAEAIAAIKNAAAKAAALL